MRRSERIFSEMDSQQNMPNERQENDDIESELDVNPDYVHFSPAARGEEQLSDSDVDEDLFDFLRELEDLSIWDDYVTEDGNARIPDVALAIACGPPRSPVIPGVPLDSKTPGPANPRPVSYLDMNLPTRLVPGADHNPDHLKRPFHHAGRSGSIRESGHYNTSPVTEPLTAFLPYNIKPDLSEAKRMAKTVRVPPGDPSLAKESLAVMLSLTMEIESKMRWMRKCDPTQQPRAMMVLQECTHHFQRITELFTNCRDLNLNPIIYTVSQTAVRILTQATSRSDRNIRCLSHVATKLRQTMTYFREYLMEIQRELQIPPPPHKKSLFQERLEDASVQNQLSRPANQQQRPPQTQNSQTQQQ